ncbi:unnamed protein product [Schistocephalus solidus]|uniref:Integrator complex subunit 13 n=1 Tax=Schistocephalus solidus TaxID=70667 RepID=A0A183TQV8_SCHSO|nr:unnamed protein product [Schistocephalus solidus]
MLTPHPVDDETTVGPSVGTLDHLCHQYVLLMSPVDEDIIQQAPVPQTEVILGYLLSYQNTEENIGQAEVVLCTGSQKEQTIFLEAVETMGPSTPLHVACSTPGGLADPHRICSLPRRSWSPGWVIDTDNGGELVSPKRQADAHRAIIEALWQTSNDVGPDSKGDTGVTSLCLGQPLQEKL